MCECNAPIVITGICYEKLNKYDKEKTKLVDSACCSECLENYVIPAITPSEFYRQFGKHDFD